VRELPESIQERVRRGEIIAHAAEKYLVPLARANQQACLRLVEGIGSFRPSSRDMAVLYAAYRDGNAVTRQRMLEAPLVFLKAFKESLTSPPAQPSSEESLRQGLRIDPGRLVSKLLDIFNIGARINSGIAVGAALTAQFQHT
jgi:hypothetical protein